MKQKIGYVTLLVQHYDEAIQFYTEKLNFQLIEDTKLDEAKRWVLLAPAGASETCLLLAKVSTEAQQVRCGDQAGGRVFLFLHTDNFDRDYEAMAAKGVRFLEQPREEAYAKVAVFEDLYGNKWDLLELKKGSSQFTYERDKL